MLTKVWALWQGRLLFTIFVLYCFFWLIAQFIVTDSINLKEIYSDSYFALSLLGGVAGLLSSSKWGGFKSVMGKACAFFSFGLFAQAFGQIVYSYYALYLHTEIPYPSIGDIGFFGSIPLYLIGVYFLGKASGVKFLKQSVSQRLLAISLPAVILILSYIFFLRDYDFADRQLMEVFLDFAYPLGQATYLALTIIVYLLSSKLLGGIMKSKVLFIFFALIVQYSADYMFLFQNLNETWSPGELNDFIYTIAYFLMGLSLVELKVSYDELEKG